MTAATPAVLVVWTRVGPDVARFAALLDADETARMARFRRPEDRGSYAAAHGLLRLTLARLTGLDARAFRVTGPAGTKPAVVAPAPAAAAGLDVSLTHTDGLAAVAIGRGFRVGVDAEPLDRPVAVEDLAADMLAPSERADLDRLAGETARRRRFLRLWTLKEAYAKGVGLGLALPFASLAFAPPPDADRSAPRLSGGDGAWHFHQEVVAGGWILSVAAASAEGGRPQFQVAALDGLPGEPPALQNILL